MMDSSVDTCRVMLAALAMVARKSRRKIMLKKGDGFGLLVLYNEL